LWPAAPSDFSPKTSNRSSGRCFTAAFTRHNGGVWWTELRGLIAVLLVGGAIAFAWTRIEARPVQDLIAVVATTTTTTTTTVATTTTLNNEETIFAICERGRSLADELALVDTAAGPGPAARLSLDFWRAIELLVDGGIRAEIGAIVGYYENYFETAEPFDFNTAKIIVEGDKEKLQLLLTRPAPGLAEGSAFMGLCGVSVPDKPSMRASDFEDLEDRLLDPEDDE
jgi:hypothetical protein